MRDIRAIESYATRILNRTRTLSIPVPIDVAAHRLGIILKAAELGDVSGLLVLENDRALIVYNRDQAPVRQRFSIAHEIGHFLLHRSSKSLFIDKMYVMRRDSRSSQGDDPNEIEANRFAAAFLMPKSLLIDAISDIDLDLEDETTIRELADQFEVSQQAMTFRIANMFKQF